MLLKLLKMISCTRRLYLKSASSDMARLSHSTALRSWSCPIRSLHSPSVTRDEVRKDEPDGSQHPPVSLLLKTPSTHRDHTARLNMPGPCEMNPKRQRTSIVNAAEGF